MTDLDKLKCLEREIKLRRRFYPRWIAQGKMTHEEARYEIAVMEEIANDYTNKLSLFASGAGG